MILTRIKGAKRLRARWRYGCQDIPLLAFNVNASGPLQSVSVTSVMDKHETYLSFTCNSVLRATTRHDMNQPSGPISVDTTLREGGEQGFGDDASAGVNGEIQSQTKPKSHTRDDRLPFCQKASATWDAKLLLHSNHRGEVMVGGKEHHEASELRISVVIEKTADHLPSPLSFGSLHRPLCCPEAKGGLLQQMI